MNQMDYNRPQNFRRMPGQPMMQQPMMQQRPMMQQPMMQPQRMPAQPTPMMNGGNFAPRPQNPQMPMNNGMFGAGNYQQQDTMPGFEGSYNGEDWNNIKLGDVRDDISKEQAQASVDQMDQFIERMQGQVDLGVASAGNVDQVVSAIKVVVAMLQNPKDWVPTNVMPERMKLIAEKGASIAKNLGIFSGAIAKLK